MRKSKLLKIILSIIVTVTVFALFINTSYCWNADWTQFDDKGTGGEAQNAVTSIAGAIINIVSIVAVAIAIIMLIVLGIKYMSSGVAGKAEVKKNITGYVTGASILFATSGILKLLQMFINNNINTI